MAKLPRETRSYITEFLDCRKLSTHLIPLLFQFLVRELITVDLSLKNRLISLEQLRISFKLDAAKYSIAILKAAISHLL